MIFFAAVALRLIEAVVRDDQAETARELFGTDGVHGLWTYDFDDEHSGVRALIDAERTEVVLDKLSQRFEGDESFRALVYRMEAALPRPPKRSDESSDGERRFGRSRLSRAELRSHAEEGAELNSVFGATVFLSTVVALVGLHRNDVAVLVGAMVLAPLLGPNVSLAMGTTLGDRDLIIGAFRKSAVGFTLALSLSIAAGVLLPVDLGSPAFAARTSAGMVDLALASAAGVAGGLAFTTGVPASLIGVMVAVALLPPTVVLGVCVGALEWRMAQGAALLLGVNVVSVNLAAVATFAVQGVRPRRWWEAGRAKRATRTALLLWSIGLATLAYLLTWAAR